MALPLGGSATRPVGLNFGIVMTFGAAIDADPQLLAQVLPGVEAAILGCGREDDAAEDES